MEISVLIDDLFLPALDADWLEETARAALAAAGADEQSEVSVVVTTEEEVQRLNREYRGIDEPTDVLSFHMPASTEPGMFVAPPDGQVHLGEIIISYPRAVAQAAEHGHSPAKEIALLTTHGALHLLGYDHEDPVDEQRMRARELEIMASLGNL